MGLTRVHDKFQRWTILFFLSQMEDGGRLKIQVPLLFLAGVCLFQYVFKGSSFLQSQHMASPPYMQLTLLILLVTEAKAPVEKT